MRDTLSKWATAVVLSGSTFAAGAQAYSPPPPPLTVDPCAARPNPLASAAGVSMPLNCPPPVAAKPAAATAPGTTGGSAAEAFPFPRETAPAKPKEQFPFPGEATPAPTANTPAPTGTPGQFPYPGETPKSPDAVPEGNTPRYVPDAPPGESSSSSSSSSSAADLPPGTSEAIPDEPEPERKSVRRKLPKVNARSLEDRVTEDLDVARFYTDHGNYLAAYLRSKDATRLMPDDAESHFALGQAAARLGKKDEAAAEYALYLKLDPAGDKRGAARQALAGMN